VGRILVLNNYDLEQAREAVAAGASPDHILFGLNHFERQGYYSVEIVPVKRSRGLQRASAALRRFPVPLGDLDQQASVVRTQCRSAAIESAHQHHRERLEG
jgi:hypothetical protein